MSVSNSPGLDWLTVHVVLARQAVFVDNLQTHDTAASLTVPCLLAGQNLFGDTLQSRDPLAFSTVHLLVQRKPSSLIPES